MQIVNKSDYSIDDLLQIDNDFDNSETINIPTKTFTSKDFKTNKIVIGSFILLLGLSPLSASNYIKKPELSQHIFDDMEDELNELNMTEKEIVSLNEKIRRNNIITIDVEDDIIEYQFLSEYVKTMKSFYEEDSKPFEL